MGMSTNQPRKPAGTPSGGQWAPATHDEADIDLSPEQHRRLAAAADKEAYDSFERCDTDGFLSQWAMGLSAQKHRLAAEIAENGGRRDFPALFDLEGKLVPAKLVNTRYGETWAVLDGDDPHGDVAKWVGRSRAESIEGRVRAMEKKGYREGRVMARAKADIVGTGHGLSGTAWVAPVRIDGGFSRDVVVVDDGSQDKTVADLAALAKKNKIRARDLDDDVYDSKVNELDDAIEAEQSAASINHWGIEAQLGYLVEQNGAEAVRRRLETGSWEEPGPGASGGFLRDVVVIGNGSQDKTIADLIDLAKRNRIQAEDLDEDVHDAKADELDDIDEAEQSASIINNDGLHSQIGYLVEQNGAEAVRRRLETGSWEEPGEPA